MSTRDWPWLETGHRSGGWRFCYLVSISCSKVQLKWLAISFEFWRRDALEIRLEGPAAPGCASSEHGAQTLSCTLLREKAWHLLLLLAFICYNCGFGSFSSNHKFVGRELGRCLVIYWPWPTDSVFGGHFETWHLFHCCLWLWGTARDCAERVGKPALPSKESQKDISAFSFKQVKMWRQVSLHHLVSKREMVPISFI